MSWTSRAFVFWVLRKACPDLPKCVARYLTEQFVVPPPFPAKLPRIKSFISPERLQYTRFGRFKIYRSGGYYDELSAEPRAFHSICKICARTGINLTHMEGAHLRVSTFLCIDCYLALEAVYGTQGDEVAKILYSIK